jgi:hypothetical protein
MITSKIIERRTRPMKTQHALFLLLFIWLFIACNATPAGSPTPHGESSTSTESALSTANEDPLLSTTTPEVFNPAPVEAVISDKARSDLATRLGLDLTSIEVAEFTSQDWPDGCLGLAPAPGQECAKSSVPGWRIVLNAAGHTHEYRATAGGSLISYSGPVLLTAPEACRMPQTSFIYSPEDGYCFAYPVYFHRDNERGPIAIFGPAYGPGPEPLYASMTMEISVLPEGQTLEQAVDAFIVTLGDVPLPQTHQTLTVGGEPAVMLEVVPGMLGSRDLFFAHGQLLFHLTFWPAPSVTPETSDDVEDLYQTVIHFWSFYSG